MPITKEPWIRIVVPGVPVPKARPRLGRGRTYTPARTTAYEMAIRNAALKEMLYKRTYREAVEVWCEFYFPVPRSWSQKRKNAVLTGGDPNSAREWPIPCLHRADVDNLGKSATDALNRVVYWDDSLITMAVFEKHWCRQGDERTVIVVQEARG